MDCRNVRMLLHPYFDGELDSEVATEVDGHVQGCGDCRTELSGLQALRTELHCSGLRRQAPDRLRQRLARLAESRPRRSFGRRLGRREWLAYAASLLLTAGAGAAIGRGLLPAREAGPPDLLEDLLSSHLRALAAASPIDVASSDRHTVKPWFAGRVAETPPVVDLAADGFALLGGRVDYVGSRRVAALTYRRARHLIDVFILPDGDTSSGEASRRGYNLITRPVRGLRAWFVSDLNIDELKHFADLLQRQAT
jgi:anti-sigma factor RsiW